MACSKFRIAIRSTGKEREQLVMIASMIDSKVSLFGTWSQRAEESMASLIAMKGRVMSIWDHTLFSGA